MLLLVMGNNYAVLFIGWEGVGLCSYLLIGYYYDKVSAAKAPLRRRSSSTGSEMLPARDFPGLHQFQDARLHESLRASRSRSGNGHGHFCLLVGAVGKSAQIPLYTWLPDAMEVPRP